MIRLESRPEGTVIAVRAQPGARRTGITGEHDGALRIAVSAAPEKGKANAAIVKVLAETLHIPKSSIELLSGNTSRSKKILLRELPTDAVESALKNLIGNATSQAIANEAPAR